MVYARNWYEINNGIDYTERSSTHFHINQQTFIIYYWVRRNRDSHIQFYSSHVNILKKKNVIELFFITFANYFLWADFTCSKYKIFLQSER